MKLLRFTLVCLAITVASCALNTSSVYAQCAMCSLNAENGTQHGNTVGNGLNNGIYFLLAMPFLIGAGIGVLWYKKFRLKEEKYTSL